MRRIRRYYVYVCAKCLEQASQSYTGEPHLVCHHAMVMEPESIKRVDIEVEILDNEIRLLRWG
jgi:hypothetical protein